MPPVFRHRERVRWMDTDTSGRIHYTAMLRYFEAAEQEFLRSLGFTYPLLRQRGVEIPRVHIECDFRAPIVCDDDLTLEVGVERVGTSSVTLSYTVHKGDGVLVARGRVVFCAVDRDTGRPTPLPEDLRHALLNR